MPRVWLYDDRTRSRYYFDSERDQLVYEDDRRESRPSNVPRLFYHERERDAMQAAIRASPSSSRSIPVAAGNQQTVASSRQRPQLDMTGSLPRSANSTGQSSSFDAVSGRASLQEAAMVSSTSAAARSPPSNPANLVALMSGMRMDANQGSSTGHMYGPQAQSNSPEPLGTSNQHVGQVTSRRWRNRTFHGTVATNEHVSLRTVIAEGPPERITDSVLWEAGMHARRGIMGDPESQSNAETFFPDFKRQDAEFFKKGTVFSVLWVQAPGTTEISGTEHADHAIRPQGLLGEFIPAKVRHFVVMRNNTNFCSVLCIKSYDGRGVAATGVNKSEHAIIHSTQRPPSASNAELPVRGEKGLRTVPIRVQSYSRSHLHHMARLDLAKLETVFHTTKVKLFGKIHPDSESALETQWRTVWAQISGYSRESSPERENGGTERLQMVRVYQARTAIDRMIAHGRTPREALTLAAQTLQSELGLSRERALELLDPSRSQ